MPAKGLKAGALLVAAAAMLSGEARAQHVVTEEEAGKLTLEALTAAPPRPVFHSYRSMTRSVMAVRYVRGHRIAARHALAVAYHPAGPTSRHRHHR